MKSGYIQNIAQYLTSEKRSELSNKSNNLWKEMFFSLGHLIGKYPRYFIIVPFFLSLLGLTGLQQFNLQDDMDVLFKPIGGRNTETESLLKHYFPTNSSQFDVSRITDGKYLAKIYITAKDGDTLLKRKIWDEVVLVNELIQNVTIRYDGLSYTYQDICSKWHGECYENTIYNMNELVPQVEDKEAFITYPIMIYPFVIPMVLGGVDVNETEGIAESIKAVLSIYFLNKDTTNDQERAKLWEEKLQDLLSVQEFNLVKVHFFTSQSVGNEVQKISLESEKYTPFAFASLLIFTLLAVSSFDCVRSKFFLGIVALITVLFAVGGSFGILMYAGIPFVPSILTSIFIILGIGFDNMFQMLSSWRKTKIQDPVPTRLGQVYSTVAIPMIISYSTITTALVICSTSAFPGLQIFSIYLGLAFTCVYLWFLTFFGGFLALSGNQEYKQKHSIFCITVPSRSEIKGKTEYGCIKKIFCLGGINKNDPWNPVDNEDCIISDFFRYKFCTLFTTWKIKAPVMFLFVLYFTSAIYGITQVEDGLNPKHLALDNSYLNDFFDIENMYFRKFPFRVQVLFHGNITYSSDSTLTEMKSLNRKIHKLDNVGSPLYTENWYFGFQKYLRRNPHLKERITNESSFIEVLKNHYFDPYLKDYQDVAFNDDKSQIVASRMIFQAIDIEDWSKEKEVMRTLEEIAAESPLNISYYHPAFLLHDQNTEMKNILFGILIGIIICPAMVIFFFTLQVRAFVCIVFSTMSIQLGVLGYMSLCNIRLDTLSGCNLITNSVVLVIFTAKFLYHFECSKLESVREKITDSLYICGESMLKSYFMFFFGAIAFVFIPAYLQRTYFLVLFFTAFLGTVHSIFFLPTFIVIFGDLFSKKNVNPANSVHFDKNYQSNVHNNNKNADGKLNDSFNGV